MSVFITSMYHCVTVSLYKRKWITRRQWPSHLSYLSCMSSFSFLLHTLRPAAGGYKMAKLSQSVVKNAARRV